MWFAVHLVWFLKLFLVKTKYNMVVNNLQQLTFHYYLGTYCIGSGDF